MNCKNILLKKDSKLDEIFIKLPEGDYIIVIPDAKTEVIQKFAELITRRMINKKVTDKTVIVVNKPITAVGIETAGLIRKEKIIEMIKYRIGRDNINPDLISVLKLLKQIGGN